VNTICVSSRLRPLAVDDEVRVAADVVGAGGELEAAQPLVEVHADVELVVPGAAHDAGVLGEAGGQVVARVAAAAGQRDVVVHLRPGPEQQVLRVVAHGVHALRRR
jgi:hypothetical protein